MGTPAFTFIQPEVGAQPMKPRYRLFYLRPLMSKLEMIFAVVSFLFLFYLNF